MTKGTGFTVQVHVREAVRCLGVLGLGRAVLTSHLQRASGWVMMAMWWCGKLRAELVRLVRQEGTHNLKCRAHEISMPHRYHSHVHSGLCRPVAVTAKGAWKVAAGVTAVYEGRHRLRQNTRSGWVTCVDLGWAHGQHM